MRQELAAETASARKEIAELENKARAAAAEQSTLVKKARTLHDMLLQVLLHLCCSSPSCTYVDLTIRLQNLLKTPSAVYCRVPSAFELCHDTMSCIGGTNITMTAFARLNSRAAGVVSRA